MQDETIVSEFSGQAEAFNRSAVFHAEETLGELVRVAAPGPGERWLDVACGPGIVARELAGLAREVHGVDMTPAMIELARREAATAGLTNVTFAVGDATALDMPSASVDGAVARFTIHHVPVPGRMVEEMARVVRRGGRVILADHVADSDADAAAWELEIERLRDPSHWATLPVSRLRAIAERAGLVLEQEALLPILVDFDEWLGRGSGGDGARRVIEQALAERPEGAKCFEVMERDDRRLLQLRMWLARWRA